MDVQTRQFEVHRRFDSFDDFWQTAHGSPRLRELFTSLPPDVLRRLSARARLQLGLSEVGPVVLNARANAVKGRKPAA